MHTYDEGIVVQAHQTKEPMLPMTPGKVERRDFDVTAQEGAMATRSADRPSCQSLPGNSTVAPPPLASHADESAG